MEYIKLSDISTIIMGQSPNSDTYNEIGEGVPFFQGKADFGRVNPKVRMYCSKPTKLAEVSDILMSVRAPVGDVNIANEQCCIGRGLCAIRGSIDINNKFLYYYLITMKEELNSKATGSTFKAINKSILEEVTIPNISIDKQNNIVKVLDKAQELIDKRREQIEDLDKLIKSQFIEMFGDPVSNPKGWKCDELKNVTLKITDGKHGDCENEENSGYYFISAKDINDRKICTENSRQITKNDFDETNKRTMLQSGDIVIVNTGATIGKTAIATKEDVSKNLTFQKSVAIVTVVSDKLLSEFLEQYIIFDRDRIYNNASGSAQKNWLLSQMRSYKIILPPVELQNRFVNFVKEVDKLKFEMVKSLKELEDNFSSLMQKAFKGELF